MLACYLDDLDGLRGGPEGRKTMLQELGKLDEEAEARNDSETLMIMDSIRKHMRMREQPHGLQGQSPRTQSKRARSSSSRPTMPAFVESKDPRLQAKAEHNRLKAYVKRQFENLKFIKRIQQSEGGNVSNFIVSQKDQHILSHDAFQIERDVDAIANRVKNMSNVGTRLKLAELE